MPTMKITSPSGTMTAGGWSWRTFAPGTSIDFSYLQDHEPGNFKKSGPGEHCLVEHDSLKISHGK